MDEAIDLIHLGLIKSEDISIDAESFKKMLNNIWIKKDSKLKIKEIILNENFGKFIAANVDKIENDEKLIDELLFSNLNKVAKVGNQKITKNYLECKEKILFALGDKIDKHYKELLEIEKICCNLDKASKEDIEKLKEFLNKTDHINKNKKNNEYELTDEEKELKSFLDKHDGIKILNSLGESQKVLDVQTNIGPKVGLEIENKRAATKQFTELFPNNDKFESYKDFLDYALNIDTNSTINKDFEVLIKLLDEYKDKMNIESNRLTFIRKSEGANLGVIVKNSEGKLFFIKKENKGPAILVNLLLGDKLTPKMYKQNYDGNEQVMVMTEGVGNQGLDDIQYKVGEENYFLNKIKDNKDNKDNKEFGKKFAKSFCDLYVKGYVNNVLDIRRDNIRVQEDGGLVLIDTAYDDKDESIDIFNEDISHIFKNDIDEKDFVKNMFEHVFFQNQCVGIGRQNNPLQDETDKILDSVIDAIGYEAFEEILIDKIASCGIELEENYKKALKDLDKKEQEELKNMYKKAQKKYNNLLSNIQKFYPIINVKINEKTQEKENLKIKKMGLVKSFAHKANTITLRNKKKLNLNSLATSNASEVNGTIRQSTTVGNVKQVKDNKIDITN